MQMTELHSRILRSEVMAIKVSFRRGTFMLMLMVFDLSSISLCGGSAPLLPLSDLAIQ